MTWFNYKIGLVSLNDDAIVIIGLPFSLSWMAPKLNQYFREAYGGVDNVGIGIL